MKNYKSMLKVSDTFILDVADLTSGHSAGLDREGINNTTFLAFFRDQKLELFVDQDEFYKLGETITNKAASDSKWRDNLKRRSADFVNDFRSLDYSLSTTNFTLLDNESLAHTLLVLQGAIRTGTLEFHDENFPAYSLALQDKLNIVFKKHNIDPNKVTPVLLRAKEQSPIEKYEAELAKLALNILRTKRGELPSLKEFRTKYATQYEKLGEIHNDYTWITAAWSGKGKTVTEMYRELRGLVSAGSANINRDVRNKKKDFERDRRESTRTLNHLKKTLSKKDYRLVEFAVTAVETGRVRIDMLYQVLFHAFNLYREIAKRLNTNIENLRFLLKEEIVACLTGSKKLPIQNIQERKKYALLFFEHGTCKLYVGNEAHKWEGKIQRANDKKQADLKGQVAFSKGVVNGKVKIIMTPDDMKKMKNGDILVSSRTYPDLLMAMKKASAMVTELGGLLSHAAIVSRELKIPCVVGITDITKNVKDGDEIRVDTEKGVVEIIKRAK